jgi:hypothetical protein
LSFCFLSTIAEAHSYFFAFAEVEYNELNETFEATIIAAAHDVETVFIENCVISKSLDYAKKNKKEYYAINEDLNKQFSIFISSSMSELIEDETHYTQIELILDGFEVLLNALTKPGEDKEGNKTKPKLSKKEAAKFQEAVKEQLKTATNCRIH